MIDRVKNIPEIFRDIFAKMNLLGFQPVYICETGFDLINEGGEDMDEFEKQLDSVRIAVERFVRYRLPSQTDADDVLQEI